MCGSRHPVLRLGVLVTLVLFLSAASPRARAEETDAFTITVPFRGGPAVDLSFEAEPALGDCVLISNRDRRLSWTCSEYTLEVTARSEAGASSISFVLQSRSGAPFVLRRYGARVVSAYTVGDGIWSYNHLPWRGMRDTTPIAEPFEADTSPNRGIPFAVMVDSEGKNRLALGLIRQDRLAEVRGRLDAGAQKYTLSVDQVEAATASRHAETFYFSRSPESWFAVSQDYTRQVDRSRSYEPLPIPESAYDPTYDSWYWTTDSIDQALVWDTASRASALGFKNYLIDAGWDVPPGEYPLFLEGSTGDYRPPAATFPDFPGLLGRIRSQLGMRVMLWMQQFALGRKSIYYPELSEALSYAVDAATGDSAETAALCPRVQATRSHLARLFERVIGDYRPDALWFDWQENIPPECSAGHLHDYASFAEGYNAAQQETLRTVLQGNPDLFVELRWPFANLNNKPYAHLWQPFDSPNDFETMRLQAMAMRAFSAGVLIGTDEMYWNPELTDSEAARFMATVVFTGVPYFGQDLPREPESRREMIRAWLAFYQKHRTALTGGTFRPYGDPNHPDQVIEGRRETFIYYGHPSAGTLELQERNGRVYIVNASESGTIDLQLSGLVPGDYVVERSDLLLNPGADSPTVRLEAVERLRYDVAVGCLLTLTHLHGRPNNVNY